MIFSAVSGVVTEFGLYKILYGNGIFRNGLQPPAGWPGWVALDGTDTFLFYTN
jgi:hypothetical protein